MSVLSARYFHDEATAFDHLESVLWTGGPVCPHCGSISGRHYDLRKTRMGLRKCSDCRKQFTVKVGTVFESAHIPLNKMLQAVYLMCASKKGISAHQLHRTLEITYKSAWFLAHRIRLAMAPAGIEVLGGEGEIVEIDETYIGKQDHVPAHIKGAAFKNVVLSLVERGGSVRSFHVDGTSATRLEPFIRASVDRKTAIMTDEGKWYTKIGTEFASHETVHHGSKEYARGNVSTNTIEGFFSNFKRGMKGVYQHCSEKHPHRYLAEFDFRYSNRIAVGVGDRERAGVALAGIIGKRLKYRDSSPAAD